MKLITEMFSNRKNRYWSYSLARGYNYTMTAAEYSLNNSMIFYKSITYFDLIER